MVRFGWFLVLVALVPMLVLAPTGGAAAEEVKLKEQFANATLTLNADIELADGKTLADGVVLITHGTLAHKDMEIVAALQDLLKERALTSLAINLALGQDDRHGMFDCKTEHHHLDSDAMHEIATWVAWLKARGAGLITVLGHSRGGNQTARYAAGKPDPLVKKVVLVAPPTWKAGRPANDYEKRYAKMLDPLLTMAKTMIDEGRGHALIPGVDFLYCPASDVSARTFYDYYRANPDRDTPGVIKRIRLPVLAVAAGGDAINPGFGPAMKGWSQKNVKVVVVEDADHFFRDLYGEDLADAVAEFVKGEGS